MLRLELHRETWYSNPNPCTLHARLPSLFQWINRSHKFCMPNYNNLFHIFKFKVQFKFVIGSNSGSYEWFQVHAISTCVPIVNVNIHSFTHKYIKPPLFLNNTRSYYQELSNVYKALSFNEKCFCWIKEEIFLGIVQQKHYIEIDYY